VSDDEQVQERLKGQVVASSRRVLQAGGLGTVGGGLAGWYDESFWMDHLSSRLSYMFGRVLGSRVKNGARWHH
jgi:hypothetical protein